MRFHDLHHTVIIESAEMGVPDYVMESIDVHLSRRMLERYSHVRIDAKSKAPDVWRQKTMEAEPEEVVVLMMC